MRTVCGSGAYILAGSLHREKKMLRGVILYFPVSFTSGSGGLFVSRRADEIRHPCDSVSLVFPGRTAEPFLLLRVQLPAPQNKIPARRNERRSHPAVGSDFG